MPTVNQGPRLVRGGIVVVDPDSGASRRVIAFQYNPESLTRSFQPQAFSTQEGDRSEALRLKGPPTEVVRLEAEIDAADQLEAPGQNPNAVQYGLQPYLAVLELMLYPTSSQITGNQLLADQGVLEIVPMEAGLTLFVWGKSRVLPVRLLDLSVTEEAFDTNLNPIRAKLGLSMRVLNANDLGVQHRGSRIFLAYLKEKERLAGLSRAATLEALGIGGLPL
jgi:hypothetical protein